MAIIYLGHHSRADYSWKWQITFDEFLGVLFGGSHAPRPRWLAVIHVYFDESGQDDGAFLCTVSGWLGTEDQWKTFDAEWKQKRKPMPCLHMRKLRWGRKKNDSLQRLLAKLSTIPYSHGLKPLAAQMLQSTYKDHALPLAQNPTVAFMYKPYMVCLQVCIQAMLQEAQGPIVFFAEQQDRFSFAAEILRVMIAINARDYAGNRVFGPTYLPSCSAPGLEIADFLTFALAQHELDPRGIRARFTGPLLDKGGVPCFQVTSDWITMNMGKLNQIDADAEFQKAIREGNENQHRRQN